MSDIAEVIKRRMHLDDHLQDVRRFTGLFQISDSNLLDNHIGVVELCEQEAESPGIRLRAVPDQLSNVIRGVETNFLHATTIRQDE